MIRGEQGKLIVVERKIGDFCRTLYGLGIFCCFLEVLEILVIKGCVFCIFWL
jgi:hypothetical protein